MEQVICPATGFEVEDGYKEMIAKHVNVIKDNVVNRKNIYMMVNKEITPLFTYKDLYALVKEAVLKHGTVCKFNIGFGLMLRHKITNEYRYYYVSVNHLLFKHALLISKLTDVRSILKQIYEMNIVEHYYMLRPESSWVLAGLPNVLFKLMYIRGVLLG